MKNKFKIFTVLIALLMLAGSAFAGAPSAPSHTNAVYVGRTDPGTPPQEIVLVRYANRDTLDTGVNSGDVLVWNTVSADGQTVSRDTLGYGFAGVAVTAIATPDTNSATLIEDNWGYMCIRGYCLARVDTSNSTTGYAVIPNGNTLQASFGTSSALGNGGAGGGVNSEDVGVLLTDTASDGPMPVWLR